METRSQKIEGSGYSKMGGGHIGYNGFVVCEGVRGLDTMKKVLV